MCVCILYLSCGQSPPRKSEDELREEEELQLALALSKSEAEHKEKEVIMIIFISFILLIPVNICQSVLFSELLHFMCVFYYLQITEKHCMMYTCAAMKASLENFCRLSILSSKLSGICKLLTVTNV